jgi:hypothetical protein
MRIIFLLIFMLCGIYLHGQTGNTITRSAHGRDSLWTVPLPFVHPIKITKYNVIVYEDTFVVILNNKMKDNTGKLYHYIEAIDRKNKEVLISLYDNLIFIFYKDYALCYTFKIN